MSESRPDPDPRSVTQEPLTASYQAATGMKPLPTPAGPLPQVPGYEVLDELGRGGMGVVYRARQLGLNRLVALKMILSGAHAGAQELARFKAEAEAVARLQHPNIVQVYEVGEHNGLPYFSLEFVEGGPLSQRLRGTPLVPLDAATLVEQLARAVQTAHERGIVHRDLKPANVLLSGGGEVSPQATTRQELRTGTRQGSSSRTGPTASPLATRDSSLFPKITDFGLAKQLDAEHSGQTISGAIMGTPSYMAPEQAAGKTAEIGPLADVYALGAILYECLTGRPPFRGATVYETLEQVRHNEPVSPASLQPGVPRDLDTICLKCLQKESTRRYGSALELADDLRRFLAGEPILARPVGTLERTWKWARRRPLIAGMLAAIVVLTVGGFAGIWSQYVRAEGERAEAVTAREKEETERKNAQAAQKTAEAAQVTAQEKQVAAENAEKAEKVERQKAEKAQKAERESRQSAERSQGRLSLAAAHAALREGDIGRADAALDQTPLEERNLEWRLLKRLPVADLMPHAFRTEKVHRLAFHPGGRRLALVQAGLIRVWDLASSRSVQEIPLGVAQCADLAYSPDGALLAVGFYPALGQPFSFRVFDAQTGKVVHEIKDLPGGGLALAWSPSGDLLAVASWEPSPRPVPGRLANPGIVKLYRVPEWKEKLVLRGHDAAVRCLAFDPELKYLCTGSQDRTARLWDLTHGKEYRRVQHSDEVLSVAAGVVRNASLFASSDAQGMVAVWGDVGDFNALAGHGGGVHCVAFSPDGRHLATAGQDRIIRLWEPNLRIEEQRIVGHSDAIEALAYSPGGSLLASASADRTVKLWDARGGQAARRPAESNMPVTALAVSADSQRIALGSEDGRLSILEGGTGLALFDRRGHRGRVSGVAFSPDGKTLASVSGATFSGMFAREPLPGEEPTLRLWDLKTGKMLYSQLDPFPLSGVAFSPDGATLATTSYGGHLSFREPATGKVVRTLPHNGSGGAPVFSPDGRHIALRDFQKVTVLEVASGRVVLAAIDLRNCLGLSWHPDGKSLAGALSARRHGFEERSLLDAGEDLDVIRVWDVTTGKEKVTLRGTAQRVLFTPDGRRLIGIDQQGMKFWDTATYQPTFQFQAENRGVDAAALSPDGRFVVVSTSNHRLDPKQWSRIPGEVKIYDTPQEQGVLTLRQHDDPVTSVLFSGDGSQLTSLDSRSLRRWRLTASSAGPAGEPTGPPLTLEGAGGARWSAFHDPSGLLALGTQRSDDRKGRVILRNLAGDFRFELADPDVQYAGASFSPDGNLLALVRLGQDRDKPGTGLREWAPGEIEIHDARTGQLLHVYRGHGTDRGQSPSHVRFHPDSRRVVSSGSKQVRIWEARTGKELWQARGFEAASFGPDGRLAVARGEKGLVQTFDADSGTRLQKLEVPEGELAPVLRADNRCVALLIKDVATVWDIPTGRLLFSARETRPVPVEDRSRFTSEQIPTTVRASALAFSPDGKRLAVGLGNGTIKIWDLPLTTNAGGEPIVRLSQGLVYHLDTFADLDYQRGRLELACGRDAEAALALEEALELWEHLDDSRPDLWLGSARPYHAARLLAELARKRGEKERGDQFARRAEALRAKLTAEPDDLSPLELASACYRAALAARGRGDHARARDSFGGVIRLLEPYLVKEAKNQQALQLLNNGLAGRARALTELQDYRSALADWDRLIEKFGQHPAYNTGRALTLARSGEHAQASSLIEGVAASPNLPPDALFVLGRVYARCALVVRDDAKLEPARKKALLDRYTEQAMRLLRQAKNAGVLDRVQSARGYLESDRDFDALRERDDFRALLVKPR